jgi:chromosome segregation ATPase
MENFEATVNTLQIQLGQKNKKIEELMAETVICQGIISEICQIILNLEDGLKTMECFQDRVAQPQIQPDKKGKLIQEMIAESQEPAAATVNDQVSGNQSNVLTNPAVVLSEFDNSQSTFNETSLILAEGISNCTEDELETLRSNVKQWEAWYNEYCQLLMQKDEQIVQLSSDVQWYSNELNKYQSGESESQAVYGESDLEAADTLTETAKNVDTLKPNGEVNQLSQQLECAKSELALLQATNFSLQQRLEDANDSVKHMKTQLQQANLRGDQISLERENIIGMRTRISDLDRASEVLGSQLRRAAHEKAKLEEELAVKDDQIPQLQQSLGVNKAKFELCEEQREEYKRKVEESKQHRIQLEFQLKQLTELLSEREHEAEELWLKLNQSDFHSFASNDVLNQLQKENSDLAIECSQLKEELRHLNRKLEGLQEKSKEVNTGDWKKLQNDYQALQQLYKDLEGEKELFKTEYESTLQAYNTLEYQNHDLEKMFEAGESKIVFFKEENERVTKKLLALNCEKDSTLEESQKVKKENAVLEQQINNLKSVQQEIFACKEIEEEMKSEIERLKSELESKKASFEANEKKIKELEEIVVALNENVEKLKTKVEDKEEGICELEERLKASAESNIETVNQL